MSTHNQAITWSQLAAERRNMANNDGGKKHNLAESDTAAAGKKIEITSGGDQDGPPELILSEWNHFPLIFPLFSSPIFSITGS